MESPELKKLKMFVIGSLRELLEYPKTTNVEEWQRAEVRNQIILNKINEILKL